MARVCTGDFIVLRALNEQEKEDLKLNPLYFTSTSQALSIVKDLLPTLSSSFSFLIVIFVMTNVLQRDRWGIPDNLI